MAIAFCPDCEEPIRLASRPKVGLRLSCRSCSAELEVIEVSPLELDWAYDGPIDDYEDEGDQDDWDDDGEQDWDDDDWDDDDWEDEDLDG
jgi:hypothetical protein